MILDYRQNQVTGRAGEINKGQTMWGFLGHDLCTKSKENSQKGFKRESGMAELYILKVVVTSV